jgi:hypothetical protein
MTGAYPAVNLIRMVEKSIVMNGSSGCGPSHARPPETRVGAAPTGALRLTTPWTKRTQCDSWTSPGRLWHW